MLDFILSEIYISVFALHFLKNLKTQLSKFPSVDIFLLKNGKILHIFSPIIAW